MDAVALAMIEALPATAPTVGWATVGVLAAIRQAAAVSTDGSRIFVSHSSATATAGASGSAFDVATGTNAALPTAPTSRYNVAGVWCNGRHYAVGGNVSGGSGSAVVESYVPAGSNGASGVWSTVTALPAPRGAAGIAAIGNTIYVAGGQSGSSETTAQTSLYAFDTVANTWSTLAAMPGARSQGAMVAVGAKLYFLGGLTTSGTATATVYVFDTVAGTWSTATSIGQSLTSASIPWVAVGSLFYMVSSNSTYTYDSTTGVTSGNLGARPVAHGLNAGAVVIGSSIFHVSGDATANVDRFNLGSGFTTAVLGAKSLPNPILAGVGSTLPNTPPTDTAGKAAYAQTVQTLKALAAL